MSTPLVVLAVAVAALGLALRPAGRVGPRLVALAVTLLCGIAALDPAAAAWTSVALERRAVAAGGTATATAAAIAAAHAPPPAAALALVWREPFAGLPRGALGATAVLSGPPLPLPPEHLQLRVLSPPAAGRPVRLELAADGAAVPLAAEVLAELDGAPPWRAPLAVPAGRRVELAWTPARAGAAAITVTAVAGAHRLERRGTVTVAEAPAVLVVEPSGLAAAALRAQGLRVVEAAGLPAGFRDHAAAVIGVRLPADRQRELAAAVADGFGAFVLAPAFGAAGEPLRELLPVRPLPAAPSDAGGAGPGDRPAPGGASPPREPQPGPPVPPPDQAPPAGDVRGAEPRRHEPIEVDKRAIAMVLVVDRSGSMGEAVAGGHTKMSYAKTSALQTARALTEGDEVAIVTFGNKGAGVVELPLTPAEATERVRAGVEKLRHANEFTYLLAGLQVAGELLAGSRAAVKHVVVITDGEFQLGEKVALRALAYRLQSQQHVTVSMISIVRGDDQDQEFRKEAELLTRDGGGEFLPVADPTRVPVLVSRELTRALRKVGREPQGGAGADAAPGPTAKPAAEPGSPPPPPPAPAPREPAPASPRLPVRAVAESPLLVPAPPQWPTLGGSTPAHAPADARVLLVAGDAGWPLLAFANRGLGRIGAFAADLCGEAGAEFRREPAFAARLAQWVQSVLPPAPVAAPAPVLTTVTITPPAPSPREVAALAALAGAPAVVAPPADPPSRPQRTVVRQAAALALLVLGALTALAAAERWSGARALRSA